MTHRDGVDGFPHRFNAASYFLDRHVAEGRGGRVAFRYQGRDVSYAEVSDSANRCGNLLRSLGVQPGARVLVLLPDCPEFAFAFWGAIKIGAVPVPLNPLLRPDEYAHLLDDSQARVMVVTADLAAAIQTIRPRAGTLEHVLVVGEPAPGRAGFATLLHAESAGLDAAPTDRDDPAFWLYTSGTTGPSKAVVHLQRAMLCCCESFGRHVLEIGPEDRCFSIARMFFAYGLGNSLYYPFGAGASSVLSPERFEPARVFETVARERPTLFFAVPTAYAALLQASDGAPLPDFGSVRRCLSAGEPLPEAIYRRWRDRFGLEILDGIGTTEMCNTFIANRAGHVRPGSSGTPVPGYDARIVDDEGRPVRDGAIGQLQVRGDSACAGYWGHPALTRRAFHEGWVRTGDRYSRDPDGYFWYAGRADDLLKVSGMWVSPVEVEAALIEHEAVSEAGVVGAPDRDQLIQPVAFVVLAPGREAGPDLEPGLKDFVKGRLAPYKCPRSIRVVPTLPRTATGKLQRFKLREMAAALTA